MNPKRGDHVPPPAQDDEWLIRFHATQATKGWCELENSTPGNLRKAWEVMRHNPDHSTHESRHTRLKGGLSVFVRKNIELPMWQIEVTSGGRIWYALDVEAHTVWITYAGPRHPKETDR
jgi:hypothetical protein